MAEKPPIIPSGFWSEMVHDSGDGRPARIGEYPLIQLIDSDSTKALFLSRDTLTDRPVKLVVFRHHVDNADAVRAAIVPGHDFLYPVHDLLTLDSQPVLIMPELPGESLQAYFKAGKSCNPVSALRIAREVLIALAVGEQRKLKHGFLAPEWVWLEGDSQHVRLMGLGWQMLEPPGTGELASFLASGSRQVPAPEVTEGKPTDQRADLFGVGMLIYQLLTAVPAYSGNSPFEIIRALAMGEPAPPSQFVPGLDPKIDRFVLQLLARRPEDRPDSAKDALDTLRELESLCQATLGKMPQTTTPTPAVKSTAPESPKPAANIDYDNIELAPIEPVQPATERIPKPATPPVAVSATTPNPDTVKSKANDVRSKPDTVKAAVQPDEDDLIDFLGASSTKPGSVAAKPGRDDMEIDLLPIDDAPTASRPSTESRQASGPKKKQAVTAGAAPGSSYLTLPTPLEWVFVADSPVAAIHLAGEAHKIFIRDQADKVVVLSYEGEIQASETSPEPVRLSAADQTGQLIVMVLGKRTLTFFDWDLILLVEKQLHSEPVAIAVDPLGLYVAVSFLGKETRIYNRQGRQVAEFETRQPLARMAFVPGSARLVGSTTFDQLVCAEITTLKNNQYDADLLWIQNMGIGIGHLHIIGGNGKILASCNNMGLQRLDLEGENEGTYQLGGTVIESSADYPGRFFLASTLEGSLLAVNANGSVFWEHTKGGPWRHLCIDPLGRYALAASALGEVVCMDLSTEPRGEVDHTNVRIITSSGEQGDGGAASVKSPEWSLRVADETESTTGLSIGVSDRPFRACLLDTKKKLTCFTADGDEAESFQPLGGAGRLLKAVDGWVAFGNDQVIQLLNLSTSGVIQPDLSLVQVTHFAIRPKNYGMLIIQEGDRLARAGMDGRWIWRVHLPATVESLVLAEDGYAAVSLDNSHVGVIGANGKGVGKWTAGEHEAVLLCESQARHDGLCRWVSLARTERVLRGHALDLRVLWQVETPFAPWDLVRTGEGIIIIANDKAAVLYDDSGEVLARRRGTDRPTLFSTNREGQAIALHAEQGVLYCSRFDGTVIWRVPIEGEITAMELTESGALVLADGVLSWISHF